MYGTYCSVTVDVPAPDEPGALAVRVRLVRARPEPLEVLEPGHDSRTVPTRARSARASGMVDDLLDRDAAVRRGPCSAPRGRPSIPAAVGELASDDRGRPVALDGDEPALEAVEPERAQRAAIPPIRSLSVGARQSESVGGRREERVDEAALGVRSTVSRRRCASIGRSRRILGVLRAGGACLATRGR